MQEITQSVFFHHVQEKAKRLGNPVDDPYDSVEADNHVDQSIITNSLV